MKWIAFSIAIFLLTANSFAQGHFVPSYSGNGIEHMSLHVVTATINGTNLDIGDEIAVFDGTICCGIAIIETTVPNSSITLNASKYDPGVSEGYTSGNTIFYKFWDASNSLEISGITAQYIDQATGAAIATPTFTVRASAFVKLSATVPLNQTPVANSGTDQTVNEGTVVTLDGSASSDPDNNTLTYLWTAPSGIVLSSTTVAKPTFTAPEVMTDQNYTFSLIVNDGTVNSTADQVVITVKQVNKVPIANAGTDQTVNEGATVTLDGSASSDPDNNTLTYLWTAPSGIVLSSTTVAKPTFTAPEVMTDQNYTFSLIVNDGTVNSTADLVVITVKQVNKAPIANAGTDQTVNEGATVTLDGSASSDPDNNTLTYLWTAPSGIVLSSTTVAKPTFTAPEVMTDHNYTFSLIVNNGTVNSTADQVVITVKQVNKAPIANAGTDQTVNEGATVTLDGSASSDPDNNTLTYLWTAPSGIVLSSITVAKPTFTAPEVMTDQNYTFSLIVNDGTVNSTADQVVITVKQVNKAPIANAGTDQTVNEGATVTLDGSASTDPDNNTLTYSWTAPSGIVLSSTTVAKPTFTAPEVMTNQAYTFSLIVNDGIVNSTADLVAITVNQVNKAPVANAGTDQTTNEGALVTLNGSASSDPDNNALTYYWTAPSGITLNSTVAAKPTFTAPEVMTDQNYTFSLIVTDGTVNSIADQVVITIKQINKAPVANAGSDQSVERNTLYMLDGTSSIDPDGDALTYLWTAPSGIALSSNSVVRPTFTTPATTTATNFTFTLTVSDGKLSSPSDQVVITLKQSNKSPEVNAGVDQSIDEGALVTLNGSASSDPDGDPLVYSWAAPSGITLSSTSAAKPTFTAPEVMTNQAYPFSLIVNDGTVSSIADQVIITVRQTNKAPVANAGPDQSVIEGVLVTLDGSASTDPDNNTLTYKWSAPAEITLSSTTAAKPTFTAPDVTTDRSYTFSLIVNDGTVSSIADQLFITVRQFNKAPVLTSLKSFNANEDTPQEFLLEGSDIEKDPINFSIENLPTFLHLTKKTNTSAILSGTFTNQYIGVNTFKLDLSDGISSTQETISISVTNVDDAPYIKDPIKNVSVDKGASDIIVDLKPVFADDDRGDILNFSVTSNTNDKIVTAKITGTDLTLSFSKEYFGFAEILVTATSNGKVAQSKFTVEVKIPTGIDRAYNDAKVLIYPNPTEGDVHLKFDRIPENGTWINVYTESGRLIIKSLIKSDEEKLDLKECPPGIYFIQIAQKKQKTYKVLLK